MQQRLSLWLDFARERLLALLFVFLLLVAWSLAGISHAQAFNRLANFRSLGAAQATAASTFATTAYADLPAATLSFIPARDPNQTCAPGEPCPVPHLHIWANLDATKATATTGTCAVFVNGAILANSARTIDTAAKEGTMALFADVAESVTYTGTNLIVKVQCKSGDTNTLTVNLGQLYAEELF